MASSRTKQETSKDENYLVAPKKEVLRFIKRCLMKAELSSDDAESVAHNLMFSDYRGKFGSGLMKLNLYVNDLQMKLIEPEAKPKVLNDFQAVALVDGGNGLGVVIGRYSMKMAIEKAYRYGVGFVSARGSNYFGCCSYYTLMAMEHEMIGFTCTNTSPWMVPTRSLVPALGTNPLSVGMSAGGDKFLLDMAMTTFRNSTIEVSKREDTIRISENLALKKSGSAQTDPKKASYLHPMGSNEAVGYKGYAVSLMVEVLCGILSGGDYGSNVRLWGEANKKVANLGQCFLAVNPEVFGPGAKIRLTTLLKQLRELPHKPGQPVRVPGDLSKAAMEKVDRDGGIAYPPSVIESCAELARKLEVRPLGLVMRNKS